MRSITLFVSLLLAVWWASALAADTTITQAGEKFDQDQITVKAGDTVTFKNADTVKHNITVVNPDDETKDLGVQPPGEEVKYSITKPGTYLVRCKIHPRMKLKIKVE